MIPHRLYVFTGKGGVGKTTTAISLGSYLKKLGHNVFYYAFEDQKKQSVLDSFKIPHKILDLQECAEGYMAKKLGSSTIANWIMRTPFFLAQLNMVPGFNYVIYMGYIIEQLHLHPDRIAIIDSPSSGHALTMFDSFYNFAEIFKTGFLAEDIHKIIQFRDAENILKLNILTFPSLMAVHEGLELKEQLKELKVKNISMYLNNSLQKMPDIQKYAHELPQFLKLKMQLETDAYNEAESQICASLPYSTSLEYRSIVEDLTPYIESFV